MGKMRIDINDRVTSKKPPKVIRVTQAQAQQQAHQQVRPLTLEYFDYKTPQSHRNDDLLQTLIKEQRMTRKRTSFMGCQLSQIKLPSELFSDDDEGTK